MRAGGARARAARRALRARDVLTCVERMYDHGEAVVRSYIEQLPDGRYVGRGEMDDDGITDDPIPFEVVLEVEGSTVRLDSRARPTRRPGPSTARSRHRLGRAVVIMTMLAGGGEAPNEGQFRPSRSISRPGSMFHALSPSPCFLYGWPAMQATEAVLNAVADAMPEAVLRLLGRRSRRRHVVGRPRGDRRALGRRRRRTRSGRARRSTATGRAPACTTSRRPRASRRSRSGSSEPLADGALRAGDRLGRRGQAPGRARAGHGFHLLEDTFAISTIERTKNAPLGPRRRAARPRQRGRASTAGRDGRARGEGDGAAAAEGLDVRRSAAAAAAGTARPPSATRRPSAATSARATSARKRRGATTRTRSTHDGRRPRAPGRLRPVLAAHAGGIELVEVARRHGQAPLHRHVHGLPPPAVDDSVDDPPRTARAPGRRGGRDRGLADLGRGRGRLAAAFLVA